MRHHPRALRQLRRRRRRHGPHPRPHRRAPPLPRPAPRRTPVLAILLQPVPPGHRAAHPAAAHRVDVLPHPLRGTHLLLRHLHGHGGEPLAVQVRPLQRDASNHPRHLPRATRDDRVRAVARAARRRGIRALQNVLQQRVAVRAVRVRARGDRVPQRADVQAPFHRRRRGYAVVSLRAIRLTSCCVYR